MFQMLKSQFFLLVKWCFGCWLHISITYSLTNFMSNKLRKWFSLSWTRSLRKDLSLARTTTKISGSSKDLSFNNLVK